MGEFSGASHVDARAAAWPQFSSRSRRTFGCAGLFPRRNICRRCRHI